MKWLQFAFVLLTGVLTIVMPPIPLAASECANYDSGMQWVTTIDGSYCGSPAITVVGNLAYLSLGDLYVVDLADPENPQVINQQSYQRLPGRLDANESLMVVGGAVYTPYIEIYSLEQPREPEFLLRYEMPNTVNDVCVVGDVAYVSCRDEGVVIVSLEDPLDPVLLGTVGTGGSFRLEDQGDYLYAFVGHNGFYGDIVIYDLATPTVPVEVYRRNSGGRDIVPNGDRLYIAKGVDGFEVADISGASAANPVWLGAFDENIHIKSITGRGDLAFSTDGLQCFNVSGPPPWKHIDSQETGFGSESVYLYGNYALVPSEAALDIFNIARPGHDAFVLGKHFTEDDPDYRKVIVADAFAYIGTDMFLSPSNIEIVKISNPTMPILMQTLTTLGYEIRGLAIRGDHLYASLGSGVEVFDISDPAAVESVGFLPSSGASYEIVIINDFLYIADYTGGVQVASLVDNPATPVLVGNYPAETKWIWAADPLLYVRSGGEIIVLDIGDPTNPISTGTFDVNLFLGDVLIQNSLAYVGKQESIDVVDLSYPTSPVLLTSFPTGQPISTLAAAQGIIYAPNYLGGILVLDISDPVNPQALGNFDFDPYYSAGYNSDIAVSQGAVFVLSEHQLTTLPVNCSQVSAVPSDPTIAAKRFELSAWPNPFNPLTRISFSLPEPGSFELQILDIAGRRIRSFHGANYHTGGTIEFEWDGKDNQLRSVASGIYLVRLHAGDQVATKKLMLAR